MLGPDEAPLDEGAYGHIPAGRAAQAWVAGTFAAKLIQGEGVGAVPPHHSHHKVGIAPVLLCREMDILRGAPYKSCDPCLTVPSCFSVSACGYLTGLGVPRLMSQDP